MFEMTHSSVSTRIISMFHCGLQRRMVRKPEIEYTENLKVSIIIEKKIM